jgi:hypothetical protein
MLVVVGRVRRVAMVTVDVVDVVLVGQRRVTTVHGVHVHVAGVREVRRAWRGGDVVHVVAVDVVEVALVNEVEMIVVRDRGVSAIPVVHMRVQIVRLVCHRRLQASSPVSIGGRRAWKTDMQPL